MTKIHKAALVLGILGYLLNFISNFLFIVGLSALEVMVVNVVAGMLVLLAWVDLSLATENRVCLAIFIIALVHSVFQLGFSTNFLVGPLVTIPLAVLHVVARTLILKRAWHEWRHAKPTLLSWILALAASLTFQVYAAGNYDSSTLGLIAVFASILNLVASGLTILFLVAVVRDPDLLQGAQVERGYKHEPSREALDQAPAPAATQGLGASPATTGRAKQAVTSLLTEVDRLTERGDFSTAKKRLNAAESQARASGLRDLQEEITRRRAKIQEARELRGKAEETERKRAQLAQLRDELHAFLDAENASAAIDRYEKAARLADEIGDAETRAALDAAIRPVKEKHEAKERAKKAEQRKQMLARALKMYEELPLPKLAELLEMESTVELEKWLLMLPDEMPVKISGDAIRVEAGGDVTGAIDQLMTSFSAWEAEKVGKRE